MKTYITFIIKGTVQTEYAKDFKLTLDMHLENEGGISHAVACETDVLPSIRRSCRAYNELPTVAGERIGWGVLPVVRGGGVSFDPTAQIQGGPRWDENNTTRQWVYLRLICVSGRGEKKQVCPNSLTGKIYL